MDYEDTEEPSEPSTSLHTIKVLAVLAGGVAGYSILPQALPFSLLPCLLAIIAGAILCFSAPTANLPLVPGCAILISFGLCVLIASLWFVDGKGGAAREVELIRRINPFLLIALATSLAYWRSGILAGILVAYQFMEVSGLIVNIARQPLIGSAQDVLMVPLFFVWRDWRLWGLVFWKFEKK